MRKYMICVKKLYGKVLNMLVDIEEDLVCKKHLQHT